MPLVEKHGEVLLCAAVEASLDGACHAEIVPQFVLHLHLLVTTSVTTSTASNPDAGRSNSALLLGIEKGTIWVVSGPVLSKRRRCHSDGVGISSPSARSGTARNGRAHPKSQQDLPPRTASASTTSVEPGRSPPDHTPPPVVAAPGCNSVAQQPAWFADEGLWKSEAVA